jgi:hypothetical protein
MNLRNKHSIRLFLIAVTALLATNTFAQSTPASIEWVLIQPVPLFGGSALALLGLVLLAVGLIEMWRRRPGINHVLLLPIIAGALLTVQFSTHLVESARALAATIALDTSPKTLNEGSNTVENIQAKPISITALNDGECSVDQLQASPPACRVGSVLDPEQTCNVYVECPSTTEFTDWLVGSACSGQIYSGGCTPEETGYHYRGEFNGRQCWWHTKNQAWNTTTGTNIYNLAQHFGLDAGTGISKWCYSFASDPDEASGSPSYNDETNVGAWGWCGGEPFQSGGFICLDGPTTH